MDEYIGIIKLFAGNFPPRDWALCNGQLLPIRSNTALFSILGTTYGGDGISTFGLPNFNGASPVGAGTPPNITGRILGEEGGNPKSTILSTDIPAHAHAVDSVPLQVTATVNLSDKGANSSQAKDNALAQGTSMVPDPIKAPALVYDNNPTYTENNTLHPNTVDTSAMQVSGGQTGAAGNSTPVSTMQPYLVMNFIICVSGLFPPRP